VLVSAGLHPHYLEVLRTGFASHEELSLVEVALKDGVTDLADLTAKLDATVAAVLVGYPNFLGNVEDLKALEAPIHAAGALLDLRFRLRQLLGHGEEIERRPDPTGTASLPLRGRCLKDLADANNAHSARHTEPVGRAAGG